LHLLQPPARQTPHLVRPRPRRGTLDPAAAGAEEVGRQRPDQGTAGRPSYDADEQEAERLFYGHALILGLHQGQEDALRGTAERAWLSPRGRKNPAVRPCKVERRGRRRKRRKVSVWEPDEGSSTSRARDGKVLRPPEDEVQCEAPAVMWPRP